MSAVATRETPMRPTPVPAIKTKAEQALVEQFAAAAAGLAGGNAVGRLRRQAMARFAALGLPHRRIEAWKYTDLRNLLKEAAAPARPTECCVEAAAIDAALGGLADLDGMVLTFLDGRFEPSLSRLEAGGARFMPLAALLAEDDGWHIGHLAADAAGTGSAIMALNTAFLSDGATLRLEDGVVLEAPVVLVFARSSAQAQATTTRNLIAVGRRCRATIVEVHVDLSGHAGGQVNAATAIDVGPAADVTHVLLAAERERGMILATVEAGVGAGATYRPIVMSCGSGLVRADLMVKLAGEEASVELAGLTLGRASSHADLTLVIDHVVPRCRSRELFKCVLDDEARAVFQGKVIVRPQAQKSDGKQMAQALMLSPNAEFDSKPELEIHADDVVCGHGSTAAELDGDQMFYLRARGIPTDEARALLVEAFIGEAIENVAHAGVREALRQRAGQWLQQKA